MDVDGQSTSSHDRNLEPDQWRNRYEWRLVSGRWRQLLRKNRTDIDRIFSLSVTYIHIICLYNGSKVICDV